MLLMMATYGLGAAEVLGLQIEAVDWKSEVLRVRRPKTGAWIELPDHRDFVFAVSPAIAAALPAKVDLRPGCPPVYDQGQLGSCTANAIAGATAALLLQDFTASFSQAQQDVSCAGAQRYGGDGVHDTVEKINFEKLAKIVKLSYLSGFEFADEQNPPGLDPRARAR